jgi:hypothetical protein
MLSPGLKKQLIHPLYKPSYSPWFIDAWLDALEHALTAKEAAPGFTGVVPKRKSTRAIRRTSPQ